MKDIVIIGAGGFGREVAWLIEDINKVNKEWNMIGFVDDNESIQGKEINGYKVIGNIEWLKNQKLNVVSAIGNPLVKKQTIEKLKDSENSYPVLIHPSVILSEQVNIGEGSIICAGTIMTVNIEIGKHVILNLDCTIGHDATIGDYTTILPSVNVSGSTSIGKCVNIGTSTAIIQGVSIVENSVLGAGTVVVKDINEEGTYVGVPARRI